jgi:hypothetical protein
MTYLFPSSGDARPGDGGDANTRHKDAATDVNRDPPHCAKHHPLTTLHSHPSHLKQIIGLISPETLRLVYVFAE